MYLFALFLVLYEFTTYSANDMIMPGMIEVVKNFHAPEYFVALSVSAYIFGNCIFLLGAGFMAESQGKRKTLLLGNALFLIFTILTIFSHNIHQFTILRFLQGAGLSIIAIGYALIHEHFNDKTAIKLIALMANISILAPLLGPVFGSLIMSYYTWEYIFGITAACAAFTLVGLFRYIPQDHSTHPKRRFTEILKEYGLIFRNKSFWLGTLSSVAMIMPFIVWISQAPNLILFKLQQDYTHYVFYQLISVGGLSLSSIAMQFVAGRYRMFSIVITGTALIILGLLLALIYSDQMEWIALGLMIYALGMGLANGCIMRLIMTIPGFSHSMLASTLGFTQALFFAIGITLMNEYISYHHFSLWSFTTSISVFGVIGAILIALYIPAYRNRGWV